MAGNRKHPVLRNLTVDALCAALILIVFALFQHVLPRQRTASGIVIKNPNAAGMSGTAAEGSSAEQTENAAPSSSSSPENASAPKTIWADAGAQTGSRSGSGQFSSPRSRRSPSPNSRVGMSSKGGSGLNRQETEKEEQSGQIPLSEKFSWMYTEETVSTGTSYSSPDISVTVQEKSTEDGQTTYYMADIYLKDITCFSTALARNTYGSGYRDSVSDMAAMNDAVIAINGDYYGNTNEGVVIRNGVIYRANPTANDVCVLYYDGTMRVMSGSSFSVDEAIEDGAWQAWTFGPALLDQDGKAIERFSTSAMIARSNPRTAIGYYEPGHYCMIVVDGRGESEGITLTELSRLFESLGCRAAYNLDGGNSSVMVWRGDVINSPSGGGRAVSDTLLIAEVNRDA